MQQDRTLEREDVCVDAPDATAMGHRYPPTMRRMRTTTTVENTERPQVRQDYVFALQGISGIQETGRFRTGRKHDGERAMVLRAPHCRGTHGVIKDDGLKSHFA